MRKKEMLEIIQSSPKTSERYQAAEKQHNSNALIATLVVVLFLALFLKSQKDESNVHQQQDRSTTTETS